MMTFPFNRLTLLLLGILLLTLPLDAALEQAPDTTMTPPANPDDVERVDALIHALYDVISGPAGERDWDRFRSLFIPGARLIQVHPNQEGDIQASVMTVEDYIQSAGSYFKENGFFEREIARTTDSFGHMVHLFSTYESRHAASDPEPFTRGINSIQLLNDENRWWVVTIYWDVETPDQPIPTKYLPSEGE